MCVHRLILCFLGIFSLNMSLKFKPQNRMYDLLGKSPKTVIRKGSTNSLPLAGISFSFKIQDVLLNTFFNKET